MIAGAPLAPLWGAFAVGASALVALYLLKLRRRRVEVPFAELWRRVLTESQSTALWKKLRRLVSLAIQLVLLVLLLAALADPRLTASAHGRSLVLVIDCSASMQATDGGDGRTRLAAAQREAHRIVGALAGDDEAMIVALDARPAPLGGLTGDERELGRAVDSLRADDSAGDVARALELAGDALRGRPRPTLLLLGDGAWARADQRADFDRGLAALGPAVDVRYLPFGHSGDNVGITAFAVRRYQANQTAYEVLLEVRSFRPQPSMVTLELAEDGEVVESERLTLPAGARVQRLYPDLAGDGARLTATLTDAHDALPLDDRAYALLPARRKEKVLLVSRGDLFLQGALLLDRNVDVDELAPAAWNAAASARYDAVIFDGFTPPADAPPRTHALYLDPQGDGAPFAIRGSVDGPIVTETAAAHPLMRWVALKDLNIARASTFALTPGDVAVASSFKQPIVAARERDGRKTVAFGFALARSDLPLRVAFPVLLINALDWFAGRDAGLQLGYATGQSWHLPAPPDATTLPVVAPDGERAQAPVHDGRASYLGRRVGFYRVGEPERLVAANLADARESAIAPERSITVGGAALKPPEPGRLGVRRQLWGYLVLAALVLALAEWWSYNRRVTV